MYNALTTFATAVFGRLSFCAKIGAIVGLMAGFFFGLLQGGFPGSMITPDELLALSLLLAALGWLAVLMIVGVWLRYGAAAIAMPALLNALLTATLTVFIANAVYKPALSGLIGLLVGMAVGTLLCLYCDRKRYTTLVKKSNG